MCLWMLNIAMGYWTREELEMFNMFLKKKRKKKRKSVYDVTKHNETFIEMLLRWSLQDFCIMFLNFFIKVCLMVT
jgi:hypothetical protein